MPCVCKGVGQVKKEIASYKASLAILEAFAEAHPIDIPDTMMSIQPWQAGIEISIQYAPNQAGRDKVLSIIGDTLGRNGWMKERDPFCRHRDEWDFIRTIDGVKITLKGAEVNRMEDVPIPVPPSAFPMQLENTPADGTETPFN